MPREYLPYAVIETAFLFTDHRYLSLPPSAKLIYITLWCRAFNERRATLSLTSTSPQAIARDTGVDHRTIRKYVPLLHERGLTILQDDGRITIKGVHEKGNIRWKDGPDRGETFPPGSDTPRGKTFNHSRQEGEREYEGEGERDAGGTLFPLPSKKPKRRGPNYSPEFLSFWMAYPRGDNPGTRAQAFRNWKTLLREDEVVPAILIECAENYSKEVKAERTERAYIFKPSNFLGKARYFERYLPGTFKVPTTRPPWEKGMTTQADVDAETPEQKAESKRKLDEHNARILANIEREREKNGPEGPGRNG